MPDLDLLAEGLQPDPNHPPIDDSMGPHSYVESEFPEGAKLLRCDKCGGGPDAPIHQKPVDQMERIADALEGLLEIATQFMDWMGEERQAEADRAEAEAINERVRNEQ